MLPEGGAREDARDKQQLDAAFGGRKQRDGGRVYVVPLEYFPAERLGRCAPRLAHVRGVRTVGVRVGHVVQMGHVGQLEVLVQGLADLYM